MVSPTTVRQAQPIHEGSPSSRSPSSSAHDNSTRRTLGESGRCRGGAKKTATTTLLARTVVEKAHMQTKDKVYGDEVSSRNLKIKRSSRSLCAYNVYQQEWRKNSLSGAETRSPYLRRSAHGGYAPRPRRLADYAGHRPRSLASFSTSSSEEGRGCSPAGQKLTTASRRARCQIRVAPRQQPIRRTRRQSRRFRPQ